MHYGVKCDGFFFNGLIINKTEMLRRFSSQDDTLKMMDLNIHNK